MLQGLWLARTLGRQRFAPLPVDAWVELNNLQFPWPPLDPGPEPRMELRADQPLGFIHQREPVVEFCVVGIIPEVGIELLPVKRLYRDQTSAGAGTEEVYPVEEIDFDSGTPPDENPTFRPVYFVAPAAKVRHRSG